MRRTEIVPPWLSPTRHAARERLMDALEQGGERLHEMDYEDVALTDAGMRLVRRAATAVMEQLVGLNEGELPPSRALALFLDHVFWDEMSGGLILCAELPGRSICLPIPRECWAMRPRPGRLH